VRAGCELRNLRTPAITGIRFDGEPSTIGDLVHVLQAMVKVNGVSVAEVFDRA